MEAAYLRPKDDQTQLTVSLEAIEKGRQQLDRRNVDPEVMAKFEAGMFDIGRSPWSRLGAFDPTDRSHALDLLGFECQVVLGSFSFHQIAHTDNAHALEIGARVYNRAMGRFCANVTDCSPEGTCRSHSAPRSPACSSTRRSPTAATP